jgi:hypothetical protein
MKCSVELLEDCSSIIPYQLKRYYKYSYLNVCNVVMVDYVAAINIVARAAVKQLIVMDLRLISKILYQLSYISIC